MGEMLPPPWTEIGPSLHSPFVTRPSRAHSEANSDRASLYTSTTSSLTCSPTSSPTNTTSRLHRFSPSIHRIYSRSRSHYSTSSTRLSSLILRRRPSTVDLALSEERSRCSEDSVERRGLGLMEPRPVDPIPVVVDTHRYSPPSPSCRPESRDSTAGNAASSQHQQRYVMGGIFEIMEGSA